MFQMQGFDGLWHSSGDTWTVQAKAWWTTSLTFFIGLKKMNCTLELPKPRRGQKGWRGHDGVCCVEWENLGLHRIETYCTHVLNYQRINERYF